MTLSPHYSVMLKEVMAALSPKDGALYVDGTFGAGGYSRALLTAADCMVIGIDRDPHALKIGAEMGQEFKGRLRVLSGCFGDMKNLLNAQGITKIDGLALDIGVSSMQIDDRQRGFSFQGDGPLDMRMDQDNSLETAADVVNTMDENELADVIYRFGEERASRKIAKTIVDARLENPITRTDELAKLVRSVVYKSKDGIDPATRTFQALRIYVNGELDELKSGLVAAEALLNPGGRLAVVCFHSLEDRIVKDFLRHKSGLDANPSRHHPQLAEKTAPATFKLLKRGTIKPSAHETRINPRSRSARLRAAERTDTPYLQAA